MTDSKKLALIDKIVSDALEWRCVGLNRREGFMEGTLYALQSVLMFDRRADDGKVD